jgi:hypothetical protein
MMWSITSAQNPLEKGILVLRHVRRSDLDCWQLSLVDAQQLVPCPPFHSVPSPLRHIGVDPCGHRRPLLSLKLLRNILSSITQMV